MRITVGSQNPAKILAVKEAISAYDMFGNAEVDGLAVDSGVGEQPISLDTTIQGAKNRALRACKDCVYSFGIESGLMEVSHTKTGYMNICACAVFDGEEYYIGLSSAFEYPAEVIRLVVEENLDISQAWHKAGLTDDVKIGTTQGVIGMLTGGRVTRKDYSKQAIVMAVIHLKGC